MKLTRSEETILYYGAGVLLAALALLGIALVRWLT